ncbi:MAG TPA: lysylphosphatidylglycerol synthase transmembrane domain-containing protein [Solirubrobacteraceae bacterium]|nr:lysylphosphatidylglycerol synthase transmembrane domain-containing protein [Solirubrobacteraceae bacterium]
MARGNDQGLSDGAGSSAAGPDPAQPAGEGVPPAQRITRGQAPQAPAPGQRITGAEQQAPAAGARGADAAEEMPRVLLTRRQVAASLLFVVFGVAFLYFVLPRLTGIGTTVHRIERGDSWWIGIGVALEVLSFGGYVVLFRAVFLRGTDGRIGWNASYQITMAGLVATRLFAAAGAGGLALTAWALRRSGMESRLVACRMVAFMVLLYVVYAGSMLIAGVGLATGLFPGGGSFAITVVPALVAAILFAVAGLMTLLPDDLSRRLDRRASGSGRFGHWVARAATAPALAASGIRTAIALVRTRDPGLLGALAWWGFDISVLWAMFHAFGSPPPFTVIWMSYFVGTLGNLLPLPGGLGGVEGGMIGAFAAFGVDVNLAVLAVLSYRGISFWLPTLPGAVAYLQLRRTVARWREEEAGPHAPGAPRAAAVHGS